MRPRAALWLAVALVGLAASAAGLEPLGAVAGRLHDPAGEPLGGARIALVGAAGTRTTSTAADGGFRFDGVWPAGYRLEVDLAGYQWLEVRAVEVAPGRTATLELEVRATSADESVLLTGSPLVDATADDLAFTPRGGRRLPGDEPWRRAVPGAADARDGAAPGDVAWLGACRAEVGTTLDGGPTAPAVRDLPPPALPDELPRTLLWGGLPAAGVERLGGAAWAVTPTGGPVHGAVEADWLDAALAAAARPDPVGRAGWRGPERRLRLAASAAGALGDAVDGFGWLQLSDAAERLRARPGGGATVSDDLVRHRALDWAVALDWRLRPRHRLRATASGRSDRLLDALSTVDRIGEVGGAASDTGFDAERWAAAVQLAWLSLPSRRTVVDGRLSAAGSAARFEPHDSRPAFVDLTGDGRWGGAGGTVLGGAGFAAHRDRPTLLDADLAFELAVAGGHRVELAGSLRRERFERRFTAVPAATRCAPLATGSATAADCVTAGGEAGVGISWGAGTRVLLADDGRWVVAPDTTAAVEARGDGFQLELADRWQGRAPVTVSAGLRAGGWSGRSGGAEVRWDAADTAGGWLGVAWDFEGRGRSRLYAQLGRVARPLTLDPDAGLLVGGAWSAAHLPGTPAAVDDLDAVGEVVRSQPIAVDPGLTPEHLDEAVLGVEYEVLAGVVAGAAAIRRRLADQVAAVTLDGGRSWLLTNAGARLQRDPADGSTATEPVELATGRRDLDAVVVYGRRRWSGSWQADLWLAWSELAGTADVGTLPGWRRLDPAILAHPYSPAADATAGPLADDRRWQAHLAAAAAVGPGLVVSGVLDVATGAPRGRTGAGGDLLGPDQRLVGRRGGAGRTPALVRLDGRLGWPVPRWPALELALEVCNLLDRQTTVAADPRFTVHGPGADAATRTEDRWGEPLIRLPPRTVTLTARWRF